MSLDHILLGMLREPAAGYDLGRRFEESARMFWFAELSQIYPTLKRLEKRGMLRSREAPSSRGPARRVYELMDAGREELRRWLESGPQFATARIPHIAQLFFMDELGDPEATIGFVESLAAQLRARLARYEAIEERIRGCGDDWAAISDRDFNEYSALRAGIAVAEARLGWCAETLERLRARQRARQTATA